MAPVTLSDAPEIAPADDTEAYTVGAGPTRGVDPRYLETGTCRNTCLGYTGVCAECRTDRKRPTNGCNTATNFA